MQLSLCECLSYDLKWDKIRILGHYQYQSNAVCGIVKLIWLMRVSYIWVHFSTVVKNWDKRELLRVAVKWLTGRSWSAVVKKEEQTIRYK
jgi:hypothetical protein